MEITDNIQKLYSLLHKYASEKIFPEEEKSDLFEQMKSGWDTYPTNLRNDFASFIQKVEDLDSALSGESNDAQIRNILVTIKWLLTDISMTTKMMAGDLEEILENTSDANNLDHEELLSIDTIDYQTEILRNESRSRENFSEKSFVSIFHEEQLWDFSEYWKFDLALYALSKKESMEDAPKLYKSVFSIYSYLLMSIGCCFDENDGFSIINLDKEALYELRERLMLVVEGLFQNKIPDNKIFKYQNPYL